MPNVFQASTGYRDPQKAMTLKALEARAKAAQDAVATSMEPTVVADPMQGWAGLLGTLGAKVQQGSAESAAASGRADLASIMAGVNMDTGPSMADIARISQYDPEMAQRMYEQAMETRQANLSREDTQSFQAGESSLERQQREKLEAERNALTQSESALQRSSTEGIAERGLESQADLQTQAEKADADRTILTKTLENKRVALEAAHSRGLPDDQYQAALANIETEEKKAAADAATAVRTSQDPYSATGDIEKDYNNGVYGAPGTTRAIKLRDEAIAAENVKGTPTPAAGSDYLKKAEQEASVRHGKVIEGGASARTFIADIKRMGELGQTIGTGKEEEIKVALGPYAEMFGIDIAGLGEAQAYQAIADKMAPQMRAEGSGPSSNYDAQQFLRSLPSLGRSPEGNAVIQATFEAITQDKMNAAAVAQRALLPPDDPNYVPWQDVDKQIAALPDPFELYKQFAKKTGGGGGGGGGAGSSDIDDMVNEANQ